MEARETFAEIRNFLAGQFMGATRDETLLAEVIKCLFVQSLPKTKFPGNINTADALTIAKHFRTAFKTVPIYFPDIFEPGDEFLLGPEELAWTMRRLAALDLESAQSDLIGDAYEVFTGPAMRGQEGQFFTPRNAINFLVDAVNPKVTETIIDPACGTGGFLAACLLRTKIPRQRFRLYGIDKDNSLVRLAKIHLALLRADYSHVFNSDSIAIHNGLASPDAELPSEGEYDVVLTNPPFGAKIVSALPEVSGKYFLGHQFKLEKASQTWHATGALSKRVPPQVLFLEKCVKLLRPGGRCGMVVPESLLSSSQYRHVTDFLNRSTKIKLVAGMPESLFKTSGKGGTHTKTCLLVFEKPKAPIRSSHKIFFAEAKWCGNDSRGRVINRDDLHTILDGFRQGDIAIEPTPLGYWMESSAIEDFSLSPRRYDPTINATLHRLSKSHEVVRFGDLVDNGILSLTTGDEIGKLSYGTGDIPFVRTSDLSNWEIKADPKHGISEEIYESVRAKQDVRENDLLMVKDGTYLIGTSAVITKYDLRMVYQSHLYKIRVSIVDPEYLNPFLLIAALSSEVVQVQIRSKRVTHDIIDSLGNRIHDLRLPLPSSKVRRKEITQMVRKAITDRIEARELSRGRAPLLSLLNLTPK